MLVLQELVDHEVMQEMLVTLALMVILVMVDQVEVADTVEKIILEVVQMALMGVHKRAEVAVEAALVQVGELVVGDQVEDMELVDMVVVELMLANLEIQVTLVLMAMLAIMELMV